jgi:uncharacterized protein YndB with AHSA1/START domain
MVITTGARGGYLVLADISGYTAFLSGTELEHAQGIIGELVTLIHDRLVPPLRFVKLEGDCVFCYADGSSFADGERVIELLEVCYFEFSNHLIDMQRSTTCTCSACASIGSLDLKFIAHYGAYVPQRLAGVDDILVHRLLKNSIAESTGCGAYVFATDALLSQLPSPLALPKHVETYDMLGEVTGGVHDLKPVLKAMRESRREYIAEADADFSWTSQPLPAPPAVVWEYFTNPRKMTVWQSDLKSADATPNGSGRYGYRGSKSLRPRVLGVADAIHRLAALSVLYLRSHTITQRSFTAAPPMLQTVEFDETPDGTVFHYRFRMHDRGALARMRMRLLSPVVKRMFAATGERLRGELERVNSPAADEAPPVSPESIASQGR